MRQWLSLGARIAISVGLLYYAFSTVNTGVIVARLGDLNISWMVAAIALAFIQLGLLAVRWRQVVHACRASLELGRSFRLILISTFFNQVLPSTVGGDAMRLWLFARQGAGWAKATHSVLLDRFIGLLSLALLVAGCLPWSLALIQNPIGRIALLTIGIGSIGAALSFIALGYLKWAWLQKWLPLRHLTQMSVTARHILLSKGTGLQVMAISFAIHSLTAAVAWCAAQAIDAPFSYFQALLLVPPVMLIATMPISVAGWGVREKSLVLAFAYAGLSEGDGFLIAVLLGATQFVVGIVGGIVWLTGTDRAAGQAEPKKALG